MQQSACIRLGHWHTQSAQLKPQAHLAQARLLFASVLAAVDGTTHLKGRDSIRDAGRSGDVPQRVPQQHTVCEPGQPSLGRHRTRITLTAPWAMQSLPSHQHEVTTQQQPRATPPTQLLLTSHTKRRTSMVSTSATCRHSSRVGQMTMAKVPWARVMGGCCAARSATMGAR